MRTRAQYLVLWQILTASFWPMEGNAAEFNIDIVNFSFQPATITVKIGDVVTWTQKDNTPHNSSSDTGLWKGPLLIPGQVFSITNLAAGTFSYHCDPHPFMHGTIIVLDKPANLPPTVSLSRPTSQTVLAPATLTLEATAADLDGSVVEVAFYRVVTGGVPPPTRVLLGTAATNPFQIEVKDLAPGFYHLIAEAKDNSGATTSSSEITLLAHTPIKIESISRSSTGQELVLRRNLIQPATYTLTLQVSEDLLTWKDLAPLTSPNGAEFIELKHPVPEDSQTIFYRMQVVFEDLPVP